MKRLIHPSFLWLATLVLGHGCAPADLDADAAGAARDAVGVDAGGSDAAGAADGAGDGAGDSAGDGAVEDAGTRVDAGWGACRANGVDGVCLDTADCGSGFQSTPGSCPGPADIQCCTPLPASCDPLARPQPNADLVEAAGLGGCPAGMVAVDTFCVDRYEAALLVVDADGGTTPWSPYFNPGDGRVRAVSLAGGVPQGYISGQQAAAACAEAGKRLCTDAEWLRACQGPGAWTYPYGDAREPGVCNDSRTTHPVIELYGSGASFSHDEMSDPCLNQLADAVDPTGANVGCVTAEGVFDMMGNLHEWTADPAGTFRGGFYVDTATNGDGCLYATTAHPVSYDDYSTGFRCCADR